MSELFSTSTGQIVREKQTYQGTDSKYPYSEIEYVYDSEGRKIKSTEYSYVNNTSRSYALVYEITYDKAGNEIRTREWSDGKWSDQKVTYVLNEDGTLKERVIGEEGPRYVYYYENGRTKSIDIICFGQHASESRTESYSYTFDTKGNMTRKDLIVTCKDGRNGPHLIDTYTYDDDSRLLTHQLFNNSEVLGLSSREWTYSYDWVYFPEND